MIVLGDFVNVDFRVKVSCKCLIVVIVIIIDDIQVVDFVEVVFGGVGCVNVSYIWVKVIVQQCYNVCIFEFVLICLLLVVFEFSFVFWFVVCGIQVVCFGC